MYTSCTITTRDIYILWCPFSDQGSCVVWRLVSTQWHLLSERDFAVTKCWVLGFLNVPHCWLLRNCLCSAQRQFLSSYSGIDLMISRLSSIHVIEHNQTATRGWISLTSNFKHIPECEKQLRTTRILPQQRKGHILRHTAPKWITGRHSGGLHA